MGYKKPFIPPKITATCTILNLTPIYFASHRASILLYHHVCSQSMSIKGSPPRTVNITPPGGLIGWQQHHDDDSGSSDKGLRPATGNVSRSGKHANEYHLLHGYGYPPSQQSFPGAPQFYHQYPFNMTHNSSQPTSSVSQR